MPKPSTWLDKQFRRIGFLLVLAAMIFAGTTAWHWMHERAQFAEKRESHLAELAVRHAENAERLDEQKVRLELLGAEINTAQQRARRADEIVVERKQRVSTWDRLIGDPEGQKENEDQMKRMTELRDNELATVAQLTGERVQLAWERTALETQQRQLQREQAIVQNDDQAWSHFVVKTWRMLRPWYYAAAIVYFIVWPIGWLWWRLGRKKPSRANKT